MNVLTASLQASYTSCCKAAAAELARIRQVRTRALERFSQNVVRPGQPLALLEEALKQTEASVGAQHPDMARDLYRDEPIFKNVTLSSFERFARAGSLNERAERDAAREQIAALELRPADPDRPAALDHDLLHVGRYAPASSGVSVRSASAWISPPMRSPRVA